MLRCVYDYTYECDIQESFVFFFFYYIFEFYITISTALFIYNAPFNSDFFISFKNAGLGITICVFILGPTLIPLIINSILTISIIKKKRLKMKKMPLYLVALTLFLLIFSCITPTFIGIVIGLIPPAFLMQSDDNSLEKEIQEMEKENLEQMIRVERLLLKEQVTRIKMKKLQQLMQKNEEHIPIINFK